MAKINKRLSIKGFCDYDSREFIEFDKDVGEIKHKLDDLFLEFNGLEDVTLTLSHDKLIEGEQA